MAIKDILVKDNGEFVSLTDYFYPIGSYYISNESTSPAELFGGSWIQVVDKFIRGGDKIEESGEDVVTLTTAQMPSHTHSHAGANAAAVAVGNHTHNLSGGHSGGALGGMFRDDGQFAGVYGYGTYSGGSVRKIVTWPNESQYHAYALAGTAAGGGHSHSLTGDTAASGSSNAHNNIPAYRSAYIWYRIA